jgi:hypothetical protein
VVKLSKQRSDTAEEVVERRIRKGLATEIFARKVTELAERLRSLAAELDRAPRPPARAGGVAPVIPEVTVRLGDARHLRDVPGMRPETFDRVVTSPPYAGTYDYASHQARRMAWLGMDATKMSRRELGPRRGATDRGSVAEVERSLGAVLAGIARVLRKDRLALVVIGDGRVGGEHVDASEWVRRIAPRAGLAPVAVASQNRPDPARKLNDSDRAAPPRREHAIALVKTSSRAIDQKS